MSVPWVNGTVEAVMADLRKTRRLSPTDPDLLYAAAIGMITGLSRDVGPHRPCQQRMADIVTVCEAVRLLEQEQP